MIRPSEIYFLVGVVVGACGMVVLQGVSMTAPAPAATMPNKRGYIRCVDGHWEIGNIDISGLGRVPEGEYVIRAKPEWCI